MELMDIEQRARSVLDGYPDLETENPIQEDLNELAEAVLKLRPRVRELEKANAQLRDWLRAAMRTLMHERRHGAPAGAPGTPDHVRKVVGETGREGS
jgi:hypothetical protein